MKPLPSSASSLSFVLVPGMKSLCGFPLVCTAAHPSRLFRHVWRVAPVCPEKAGPPMSGVKPRREGRSLLSPLRAALLSNKIWVIWFNTSQEKAAMAPDSTAMECFFFLLHIFSPFNLLTLSLCFPDLSHSHCQNLPSLLRSQCLCNETFGGSHGLWLKA